MCRKWVMNELCPSRWRYPGKGNLAGKGNEKPGARRMKVAGQELGPSGVRRGDRGGDGGEEPFLEGHQNRLLAQPSVILVPWSAVKPWAG